MTENKLYVTSIPRHIKETELQKVFENFGKIERYFVPPDKRYMLLWYNNKRSCEEAIKDLHGKPPYNMNVTMAKTKVTTVLFTLDERTYYDKYNKKVTAYVDSNGEVFVPLSKVEGIRPEIKGDSQSFDYLRNSLVITVNNNERSVSEHDAKIEQNLKNKSLGDHTSNKFHRRGPNFRKTVPGSFSKENVIPKPKTPESRNWSRREANVNDASSNKPAAEEKRNIPEKLMSLGKSFGRLTPQFTPRFSDPVNYENHRNNKPTETSPVFGNDSNKPRRFGSLKNLHQPNNNYALNQPSTPGFNKPSFGRRDDFKFDPNRKKTMANKSPTHNEQTSSNPQSSPSTSNTIVQKEKIFDPINPPYKSISLKTEEEYTLIDVQVVISPVRAWVTIANNADENNYLKAILNFIPSAKIVDPEVGLMCLAMYDEVWFRACVMKTSPEVLVRFIDYGNDVTVPKEDKLLELPQELCDKPALAVEIELLDGAPVKFSHEQQYVEVKPVKIVDNVVYVKVKNGLYVDETPVEKEVPVSKINKQLQKLTDALFSEFEPGKRGIFAATHRLSDHKVLTYVVYYSLLGPVQELENIEAQSNPSFTPAVGDIVLCRDEMWKRGLILAVLVNCYEIALLDYGTVKFLKEVTPLTDEVSSIPVCSAVATIKDDIDTIMNGDDIEFQVKNVRNGQMIAVLDNGLEIIFDPWDPLDPSEKLDHSVTMNQSAKPNSSVEPQNSSNSSMKPSENSPKSSAGPQNSSNSMAKPQNSSNSSANPQNSSNSSAKPQNSFNSSVKPQNLLNSSAKPQNASNSSMKGQNMSSTPVEPESSSTQSMRPQTSANPARRPQNTAMVVQSLESKNAPSKTQDKSDEIKKMDSNVKNPDKTKNTLEKLKLSNGENVRIVSQIDSLYLCVRTKSSNMLLKSVSDFMINVHNYESLKAAPVVGDVVAAEYDGGWYRALVKGIRNSEAFIYYVDYGHFEHKSFDCLATLPEQLYDFPETLINIRLAGIDRRFSEEELEYLEMVSTNKKLLNVQIIDESKNIVELYFKNREKLSEKTMTFDRETLSVGTENSNDFTYNNVSSNNIQVPDSSDPPIMSIETQKVPFGKVEIKYLAEMDLSSGIISFTLYQSDLYKYIMGEFSETLHNYCEKIAPGEAYCPSLEEIVLAKYNGIWARGLVMNIISEFESSIFMIDSGETRTVEIAHLRKIPKELSEYDALASIGLLEDMPDEPSNKYLSRLEELLSSAEKHEVIVRKYDANMETYLLAFPAIQAILKNENLR